MEKEVRHLRNGDAIRKGDGSACCQKMGVQGEGEQMFGVGGLIGQNGHPGALITTGGAASCDSETVNTGRSKGKGGGSSRRSPPQSPKGFSQDINNELVERKKLTAREGGEEKCRLDIYGRSHPYRKLASASLPGRHSGEYLDRQLTWGKSLRSNVRGRM